MYATVCDLTLENPERTDCVSLVGNELAQVAVLSDEEVGGRSVFHWVTPSETSLLTAKFLDPIAASLCSVLSRSFRVCEGYRAHDKGGTPVFFFVTC